MHQELIEQIQLGPDQKKVPLLQGTQPYSFDQYPLIKYVGYIQDTLQQTSG